MRPHQHRDSSGTLEPCLEPGKTPLVRWKPLQTKLPTEKEVRGWFRRWPEANIGLATGRLSGIVVIDLDGDVAQQDAENRGYDAGPWVSTGRPGGKHAYCAYREDAPHNFVKVGGIDFRGDGGYVVLPPSRHRSGVVYSWGVRPASTETYPFLPAWVNELAAARAATNGSSASNGSAVDIDWLLEHGVDEHEPGRDDTLYRAASKLRGQGVSVEDAYDTIARIAAVCRPPFLNWKAKVDSAYQRYEPNPPPIRVRGLSGHVSDPEDATRNGTAGAAAVDEDDGRVLYAVPTFPTRVLPPALRDLAEQTSLPTPLVAGAGLAVLATCVGGESELVLHETQRERAIVWLALLGRNGVGKSPAMDLVYRPLKNLDDAAYGRYLEARSAWLALDPVARKQVRRPTDPRMLRDDLSGPGLLRQLGQVSDTGLRLDELSSTLRKMRSGRDGQTLIDPGQMLKMWSGEGISYTRVGGGVKGGGNEIDLYVPRPTVTLCGDLQTFLHPLLGSDTDGMRVRWLPHQWEDPWREARRYPTVAAVEAWATLVQRLVDRRSSPRKWHVDRAERKLVDDLVTDWMARADNATQATYQAALLKADRQVMRVALVLAEAEADDIDGALYVDAKHLEAAAEWVEYSLRVWLALGDAEHLSLSRENQALDPAVERIRVYIEQQGSVDPTNGRRYVTARQLRRYGVAGIIDSDTLTRAVRRYGAFYPGCVDESTPPTGGPKSIILWAPRRRRNDPTNDDFDPTNAPFNPTNDPTNDDFDPTNDTSGPLEPDERPAKPDERPDERPAKPDERRADLVKEPRRARARGERSSGRKQTAEAAEKRAAAKAAKELARLEAADLAAPTLKYTAVLTDADLTVALAQLGNTFGLDTETTGLDAKRDRLRTINLSDGATHIVIDTWRCGDLEPLRQKLKHARLYMHTFLFDAAFLAQAGIELDPSRITDVRTLSVLLEAEQKHVDFSLSGIAKRRLAEHVDKAEQKSGWDAPVLRHAKLAYAAEDARVTFEVGEVLRAELAKKPASLVVKLEQETQAPMLWVASAGAPADRAIMAEAIAEQETLVAERLSTLNVVAGAADGAVNWRSPKQVLPVLQARGLHLVSTGEDALMDAETEDPLVVSLLAYRSAGACLGLLRRAQTAIQDDGRIYPSYNPMGAVTGRMACSEPNLQNLPRETRAREAIRPLAGRILVRADYSQLQLVIAAYLSGDQEMRRILNEPDGDVHQRTADAVGCTRQEAKAVNFGFLFGAQAKTFRREQRKNGVLLSELQAFEYRQAFMATYAGIADWHANQAGWDRPVPIVDPSGSGRLRRRVASKNMQLNTPVQMVEAHGFKRAIQEMYADREAVPSARLVMMVHDELIAECDVDDADATAAWLKRHMVYGMQPLVEGVMVRVDATIVASYSDDDKKRGRAA